jgi:DNA-directed RNA polymerase subunit RPC12/RpoP
MRHCSECGSWCDADEFSNNQWRRGPGASRCIECVDRTEQPVECDVCARWLTSDNALAQHMKTHPECQYCDERFYSHAHLADHVNSAHNVCPTCGRDFRSPNGLFQHQKSHAPRNVSCPICGEQRFRNAANAVAHVESGYCAGCLGKDHARAQIHQFVTHNAPRLCVPAIENGYGGGGVPDRPYRCTDCGKTFASLSAQMNHEGDVHGNNRRLQQLGW